MSPTLDSPHLIAFWLVLIRLSGLFLSAPLLSQAGIPMLVKTLWAVLLSFLFSCLLPVAGLPHITTLPQLMALAAIELLVGVLLGMTAQLLLVAMQLAGEFIAVQMGLNMASLLDPITHSNSPVISQLLSYLGLALFLVVNGHHWLLAGFAQTLIQWPIGHNIHLSQTWFNHLAAWPQQLFELSLQFALPCLAMLLLIDIASGFLAKTMPQLNLMTLLLPAKILVGLWGLYVSLSTIGELFVQHVNAFPKQLHMLLPSAG